MSWLHVALPPLIAVLVPLAMRAVLMSTSARAARASMDSALVARARALKAPVAASTRNGELEAADWWEAHGPLLDGAWRDFGLGDQRLRAWDAESAVPSALRQAMRAAHQLKTAEAEAAVRALWHELIPGVFAARLFTPGFVRQLRAEITRLSDARIPTRRPNGMNRYGLILSDLPLSAWVDGLVAEYVRPLAHALFPAHVGPGDAREHYAFTVRYASCEDVELAEHRDASVATLNVNLNEDSSAFQGSALRFVDGDGRARTVEFEPGMAILHLGAYRHAALPIVSGERTNLVVWLHGEGGYVRVAPYPSAEQLDVAERWTIRHPAQLGGTGPAASLRLVHAAIDGTVDRLN